MRSIAVLAAWVGLCGFSGCAGPEPAAVASDDALARVQQRIAEREYRASENESGLQAPNRAHNLRTYFEKSGIRVHDRIAGGSPQLFGMSLSGVGRGNTVAGAASGGDVVADGNRVEIRRPGLVEWYVNSPAGLEQGFTIERRPDGEGLLAVELTVAGARLALRGEEM